MTNSVPWLLVVGAVKAACPGGEFEACQTDIFLDTGLSEASSSPGRSAKCADWSGCEDLGLFGDCCPESGGIMLGCCSARLRRLLPSQIHRKGITVDDTTLRYCAGRIPQTWPNAESELTSLRIFQAWNIEWPAEERKASWKGLSDFVKAQKIKVLVGAPVTCNVEEDKTTWQWTKEFLQMIGPKHVMGLAIGNELELLTDHADARCIREMWEGGRLWKTFTQRVSEFDQLGFESIPVTSVFTAAILSGIPFMEVPGKALVNTFLRQAVWKYRERYAFTFNVYPYFDPNLHMNSGSDHNCSLALERAICWDGPHCLAQAIMIAARQHMQMLTGRPDDLFWIGEIGWSSPRANALHTEMRSCEAFSSLVAFEKFYNGFLQWDLVLQGPVRSPDHIFYFTLRDALNFGVQEFFGLLLSCESLGCKIASKDFEADRCELQKHRLGWRSWAFMALGLMVVFAMACSCIYVRSPCVQRLVTFTRANKKRSYLRLIEMVWPRQQAGKPPGAGKAATALEQILQSKLNGTSCGYRGAPLALLLKPCLEGASSLCFIHCLRLEPAHLANLAIAAPLLAKLYQWMCHERKLRKGKQVEGSPVPKVKGSKESRGPYVPPLHLDAHLGSTGGSCTLSADPLDSVDGVTATSGADPTSASGASSESVTSGRSGKPPPMVGATSEDTVPGGEGGTGEASIGVKPLFSDASESTEDLQVNELLSRLLQVKRRTVEALEQDARHSSGAFQELDSLLGRIMSSREAQGNGPDERETNLKLVYEQVYRSIQRSTEQVSKIRHEVQELESFCRKGYIPPVYDAYAASQQDIQKMKEMQHEVVTEEKDIQNNKAKMNLTPPWPPAPQVIEIPQLPLSCLQGDPEPQRLPEGIATESSSGSSSSPGGRSPSVSGVGPLPLPGVATAPVQPGPGWAQVVHSPAIHGAPTQPGTMVHKAPPMSITPPVPMAFPRAPGAGSPMLPYRPVSPQVGERVFTLGVFEGVDVEATPEPKATSKPKAATPKPKAATPKPKAATPKPKAATPKPKGAPRSEMLSLVVDQPEKYRNQAVNIFPQEIISPVKKETHDVGGRGHGTLWGPLSKAPLLFADGPPDRMAIRKDDDRDLALFCPGLSDGVEVTFWAIGLEKCHREWATQYCMNEDGTLSPVKAKDLVVGVSEKQPATPGMGRVVLVDKSDTSRRIVFKTGQALSDCLQDLQDQQKQADSSEQKVLRFRSPKCEWMGPGTKAMVLRGNGYEVHEAGGRGHAIGIGFADSAMFVSFDGLPKESMAIRKFDDQKLAMEVNFRKWEEGAGTSLWYSDKMDPAWVCKFTLNDDRTISPFGQRHLVLGAKRGASDIVLVKQGDPLQLVLETDEEARKHMAEVQRRKEEEAKRKEEMRKEALSRVTPELRQSLKEDGFAHIPAAVPLEVVKEAKKEINRIVGSSDKSADAFKGKEFPKKTQIINLINQSQMPVILEQLLGPVAHNYMASSGQIALRFPGDFCEKDSCKCGPAQFENIRKGWHIDGCPNNFLPGISDHYGKIANFDVLVGVLLSDSAVHDRLCGELCVYPGSHMALANYFKKDKNLDTLKNTGTLPTGQQTDELFSRPPLHCTGKAGDVYIANYMCAHFIAPNTSPDIRYACYFRFKGPGWSDDIHQPASMLDPLLHWDLGDGRVSVGYPSEKKPTLRKSKTMKEAMERQELEDYYASSNNDYAQMS
eukprot:symbB.v1.2.005621.t2/scaffold309.1/size276354/2